MITGFMGIAYSTDEIRNGKFVDRTLENDFLQTRYDILRHPGRRQMVNESMWKSNGEAARKQFLRMMEASNERNRIRFDEEGDEESTGDIFTYDGRGDVPKNIETVILASDVEEIVDGAFKDCANLKSVVFNEGLKKIGKNAFENCKSLDNIRLLNVSYIGDEAFLNCTGLIAIEMGSDVQHIGMGAFKNCTSLVNATIPPNVTFVGDYVFANCSELTKVVIMEGVVEVPAYAFENCVKLEQVIFPDSIEKVGDGAFGFCPNVEVVVPTLDREEAEELLNTKFVAMAEHDDSLFKTKDDYMVRLFKDLY